MFWRIPCLLIFILAVVCCRAIRAAGAGDPATIQLWLDRAVESSEKIENPEALSFAQYRLAQVLSRHGDTEKGLESARQMTNPLRKLYALKYVADAARKSGNDNLCRKVVAAGRPTAIENAGAFITSAFLDVCFAAGLPDAALKFIDETLKPASKAAAYAGIVAEYCALGDRDAAERIIRAKNLGENGVLAMASGFIRVGDVPTALEIIESLSDSNLRDGGYVIVATALAHRGDDEAARNYIGRIKNEAKRRNATGEISRFYNKDDSLEELRPKFAATEAREEKSGMLPLFVQKLVEAKEFDEADRAIEDAAMTISNDPRPDVSSKFGTYGNKSAMAWIRGQHLTIASALIEEEKIDDAAAQLAKASAVIEDLSPESAIVKWPLERALVDVLLKLGREAEALEIMRKSTGPTARDSAAAAIAIHRIKQGKINEGLSLINLSGDRHSHGADKGDVACALLEVKEDEKALSFLNSLDDSETSADAFTQVARKLTEKDDLYQLEKLYDALESPVARAHLAIESANRLQLKP